MKVFIALLTIFLIELAKTQDSIASCYNPDAAYSYAFKYYDKVVSDGYFWTSPTSPTYLGSGQPVPSGGYDCAHFVSCVIGAEPHESGGGLPVPSRTVTYGEPGAHRLGDWLISSGYGIQVNSIDELKKGDFINYDWNGDGWYDHSAFYLGNYTVAAHSTSVWNAYWSLGGAVNYRFIRIGNIPATANNPPSKPALLYPANGSTGIPTTVTLKWKRSTDPDGDRITYKLYISKYSDFKDVNNPIIVSFLSNDLGYAFTLGYGAGVIAVLGVVTIVRSSIRRLGFLILATGLVLSSCGGGNITDEEVSYTVSDLQRGATYYWKVVSDDCKGGTVESDTYSFKTAG